MINRRSLLFLAYMVAAMVAVAPGIVSYGEYHTAWDDLYFLNRAVGAHSALWTLDRRQWDDTFSIVSKSPILVLLSLPWGGAGRSLESLIGLTLVSLAVLIWAMAVGCFYVMGRLAVPWWLTLSAAAAYGLDPLLKEWARPFLADTLVSWTILLLLLLIPYETISDEFGTPANIRRGILWGVVMSVGLTAKVTFWAFFAFAFPVMLYLRWRRGGSRAIALTCAVCAAISLPAIAINIRYGKLFIDLALANTTGNSAKFFAAPAESYGSILISYGTMLGPATYIAGALLGVALIARKVNLAVLYAIFLVLLYALKVTTNIARDPRYFFPVALGLPFLFALAAVRIRLVSAPSRGMILGAPAILAVLMSWPLSYKIDLQPLRQVQTLLEYCRARGLKSIVLATDNRRYNIQTFSMGRELLGGYKSGIQVETVVYGVVEGTPIERDFQTMENSDLVVFQIPTPSGDASINLRAAEFRTFVARHAKRIDLPSAGLPFEFYRPNVSVENRH